MRGRKRSSLSYLECRFGSHDASLQGQVSGVHQSRVACMPHFLECDFDRRHLLAPLSLCRFCGAKKFEFEPPSFCCDSGKIKLADSVIPSSLMTMFTDCESPMAIEFRRIRLYNSIFSFTSFGVRLDRELASSSRGVYTFRVSGQIFHTLPPIVPRDQSPTHFQLYFWDSDNELRNRMHVINNADVDELIVATLMDILKNNPYAKLLRRIQQYSSIEDIQLHICKNAVLDQRCYNTPSVDQVAAIWVEGNNPNIPYDRDIIIHGSDGRNHQIKHYFGCYDPLQYPLFFPNGQNG
ncbi:uncharacterized protein [Henckelia pumila]|uniref:uncharacterized protein n=1 Tax=Henckelia pumila TaxID=405737 RepID=UPI003C6E79D4